MKVIVFGATGTVGKLAVEELLKAGHAVTAFARTPAKLEIKDPKLTHFVGDALKASDVRSAVKGHDAAVITLGSGMSRKSIVRSKGTLNVIMS